MPIPLPFRRIRPEVKQRYAADQELAATFDELSDTATVALERLDRAMTGSDAEEQRQARIRAEAALLDAIEAAEAGQRAMAGVAAYTDRIAFRKACARADVDRWTRRLADLRTGREALKLDNQYAAGVLLPNSVQVENTGAEGPHIFGMEPLPGTLRAGVDVEAVVDR